MKTAVIYARYSSDSQTEQSIEGQLHVCNEYAKSHNIVILRTYIDRAMSGKTDKRPDFQQMLKDSARKEWDFVLVYKFDRFGRNRYETAIHKKELKDNGVKVVSATEYLPDTPEAIIFESMLEGYAEYYSAELSQKIRRGNNESRRKGNLTGGRVLYGYKNVNKKAVVAEEEAEAVRYIFSEYALGTYVKDIIKNLTKRGMYYGNHPFCRSTVYRILKNERYSGIYNFNGETFDNIYPQIVPPEIYEIVRKKVNDNKYGKTSENVEYLLKNKIICGYCGKSIVGENGTAHTGNRMYYYKCGGRKNTKNGCNKQTIRKDLLEKLVLDGMIEEMKKPGIMNGLIAELLRIQQENSKVNAAVLILQKEQKSNAAAIDNLLQAIEQGGTAASAMKRLRELESRQNDLEEQIAIEKSKSEIALTEFQIRQFYEEALRNTPKMLINALVKKIILFDDKMQIIFNSPLKNAESAIMKVSPEYRGFSFAKKQIHIRYKVPQRADPVNFNFEIILMI